jgi:acyl-coenzyme A synthetase/AMP-(fatty) acid ligase
MSEAPRRAVPAILPDHVLFQAQARPERPAIILADRIATYDMLARGMLHVEDRLGALALVPGEVVCVSLRNPIRHLVVTMALMRLGFPTLSAESATEIAALKLPVRTYLQEPGEALIPGLLQVVVGEDWFAGERRARATPTAFANDSDLFRIEITSGSTGLPKAVSSTVAEFHSRLMAQFVTGGVAARERVLGLVGFNSGWGFRTAAHTLYGGGTLIRADTPREALHMASVYGADRMVASMQQLRDLLREQRKAPVSCASLRVVVASGALPTREFLRDVRAHLCSDVVVHYGSTETGALASAPADCLMDVEGATGHAYPGVSIEIVDPQDRSVAVDAEGIVRVRTPAMSRPWPPGTGDAHPQLRDGWFYPGDRGRLTSQGLLILAGRASEVINSGGVKRAPEYIEEIVQRHPDIIEAAAFGAPGREGIEEIHLAVVIRKPVGEQRLIAWCAEAGLDVVRVFTVDTLPKTPMGKLRRDELKTRFASVTAVTDNRATLPLGAPGTRS